MSILYKCSWRGCSRIIEEKGYCKEHKKKVDKNQRHRYKVYQTKRLMDEEQKRYQSFYCSKVWLRTRDSVIAKCVGIDILEYYRAGKIVQGNTVHHIIELSEEWDKRLDTYNLFYLTDTNHLLVHREYNKGDREKKQMQKLLISLKKRFEREFGL